MLLLNSDAVDVIPVDDYVGGMDALWGIKWWVPHLVCGMRGKRIGMEEVDERESGRKAFTPFLSVHHQLRSILWNRKLGSRGWNCAQSPSILVRAHHHCVCVDWIGWKNENRLWPSSSMMNKELGDGEAFLGSGYFESESEHRASSSRSRGVGSNELAIKRIPGPPNKEICWMNIVGVAAI